jgi:hypothetical protein
MEMKCAASSGGTVTYSIAAQTPVNTVKPGEPAVSGVAHRTQRSGNVWM